MAFIDIFCAQFPFFFSFKLVVWFLPKCIFIPSFQFPFLVHQTGKMLKLLNTYLHVLHLLVLRHNDEVFLKLYWFQITTQLEIAILYGRIQLVAIALFISIWPVFCFSCLRSFICLLNFLFAFLNYLKTLPNTSVCCTIWIDRTGIIISLTMFSNYEHFVFTWAILYSIWVFLYVK